LDPNTVASRWRYSTIGRQNIQVLQSDYQFIGVSSKILCQSKGLDLQKGKETVHRNCPRR
jgi:hypothetical protein